jgi:Cu(I)/Ag(I) efflux system membrane protein CusA/SilA
MPIRTRIDMQSTGINTPIGIKIAGPDLEGIQDLGRKVEAVLHAVPGTRSVLSDRSAGARYIDIDIDRRAAGHYGLGIAEVEEAVNIAVGGMDILYTVEGRERYPVNLRYPHELRDSIAKLKELPLVVTEDTHVQLRDLASVRVVDGPPLIKSENGRMTGWVYITTEDRDPGSYVADAQRALDRALRLPAGYTLTWAGQYQYLQRAAERLTYIVPFTLFIILLLLYLSFRSLVLSLLVMLAVPFALVGGVWLVWGLGSELSVAVAVGFIALAGVAAEFGVVMIVYLREAVSRRAPHTAAELIDAVVEGAALRVRPKAMTAAVIVAGLLPILIGSGAGSAAMQRIAAPIVGGMITAPLVSMFLIPVLYYLWQVRTGEYADGK